MQNFLLEFELSAETNEKYGVTVGLQKSTSFDSGSSHTIPLIQANYVHTRTSEGKYSSKIRKLKA